MIMNEYHVVSVSSGVPSALTAIKVIEQYGNQAPVELVFADTLAEDEDNYRFLDDLEQYTGYTITRLVDGRRPLDIMTEQNVIFTQKFAPCTRILKLEPIFGHVKALQERGYDVIMHIGYDLKDKSRGRLASTSRNWASIGVEARYPLIDALISDPLSELRRLGLEPPRTYLMGFRHANCIGQGGCVKFGQRDMIKMLEYFPDRYTERERVERTIRQQHIDEGRDTLYAHVRDTQSPDGHITLEDLRKRYEATPVKQLDLFKLDVELFEDCSVECGVTSPAAWEAV